MRINNSTKVFSVAVGLALLVSVESRSQALGSGTHATLPSMGAHKDTSQGSNELFGDCGVNKYHVAASGAAGYCYVSPATTILHSVKIEDVQGSDVTLTPTSSPVVIVVILPELQQDDKPKHCNKGEGNGSEGCDPGSNPDKGNDDENNTTPKEDHKKP